MSRRGTYPGRHTAWHSGGFSPRKASAKVTGGIDLPPVPRPGIDRTAWIRLQQARAHALAHGKKSDVNRLDARIAALIRKDKEKERRLDEAIEELNWSMETLTLDDDTPRKRRLTSARAPAKVASRSKNRPR